MSFFTWSTDLHLEADVIEPVARVCVIVVIFQDMNIQRHASVRE